MPTQGDSADRSLSDVLRLQTKARQLQADIKGLEDARRVVTSLLLADCRDWVKAMANCDIQTRFDKLLFAAEKCVVRGSIGGRTMFTGVVGFAAVEHLYKVIEEVDDAD